MAGLQDIVADLDQSLSIGPAAGSLVKELLQLIFSRSDGFKGFLDSFDAAGLGAVVNSWIGKADAPATAPHGVIQAFGGPAIAALAQKVGLDPGVATAALAFVVPKLVGFLTPGGAIPSSTPPAVAAFLSAPAAATPAAAAPAVAPVSAHGATTAPAAAPRAGRGEDTAGVNRFIFPGIAAVLAAAFLYHFLTTDRTPPAPAPGPAATTAPPAAEPPAYAHTPAAPEPAPVPAPAPTAKAPATPAAPAETPVHAPTPATPAASATSHIALSHDAHGGVAVSGVVPDEATHASIVSALKSAFGGSVLDGVSVDATAATAPWLARLSDAFAFLKAPNLHAVFDGDKVSVAAPEDELQAILAKLKDLFGGSVAVAPLPPEQIAAFDVETLTSEATEANLATALNQATINFETNSAVIDDGGKLILLRAAELIKKLPDGTLVQIDGFTDQTGDPGHNLALSQRRADAVRQFLIDAGVSGDGLAAKGHGSAASTTSGASRTDRRIEFSFTHR
ncbi:OmpA family protein [Methylocella sp.]|uniref:OmpA family protein n=1 Tax=Methylocella sp. TaxID=1978226 RepID=UPI003783F346